MAATGTRYPGPWHATIRSREAATDSSLGLTPQAIFMPPLRGWVLVTGYWVLVGRAGLATGYWLLEGRADRASSIDAEVYFKRRASKKSQIRRRIQLKPRGVKE